MARRDKVFNRRVFNRLGRPKLLRKEIPASEAAVGALLLFAILGMTLWLWAQRTNYDPSERDIDTAVLVAQSVEDNLYETPLKQWRDPSLGEAGAAPVDLGPFDPSLLADGWRSASSPHTFTSDTLYEKINGQAEQYLKFGFEKLTVIELEHPGKGRSLDVFLYDQGTFEGSLGVYEEQRGGKPVVELDGVRYTPNALGAIGMNGRIFFHAIGDAPDASLEAMTQRVLKGMTKLGEQREHALPPEFVTLNRDLSIPFERIAYQPSNVFQYRFAQRFWFARLDDSASPRLFVHEAESPAAAKELFDKLGAELLEDYDALDSAPDHAFFQHKFLKTYFGLRQQENMVFGVEKHPEREAGVLALMRLKTTLAGEDEKSGKDNDAESYYDEGEEGGQ